MNRILAPYLSEAVRLLQDGCRIEDVDGAMTAWGMPVGPLALLDDVGLDVAVKAAEVLHAAFPERIATGGEDALVAGGRLGRKNGKGFYEYDGTKRRRPSDEAYAALRVKPADKTPLPPEVIQSRLVLPMVNEAAFCLEDEIVKDPARLDLAMIFGTGFPPFRGGLLRWADSLGLGKVFTRLDDLSERLGPRFAPAERIRELANAGSGFYGSPRGARRRCRYEGRRRDRRRAPARLAARPAGSRATRVRLRPRARRQVAPRGPHPGGHALPVSGDPAGDARDRRRVPRLLPRRSRATASIPRGSSASTGSTRR